MMSSKDDQFFFKKCVDKISASLRFFIKKFLAYQELQ